MSILKIDWSLPDSVGPVWNHRIYKTKAGMKVLVAGHSFIRRFRNFLTQTSSNNRVDRNFGPNLGLPREEIFLWGWSGLKVSNGKPDIWQKVTRFSPDVAPTILRNRM